MLDYNVRYGRIAILARGHSKSSTNVSIDPYLRHTVSWLDGALNVSPRW